jgi:uncharacterized HAD superfamily protein
MGHPRIYVDIDDVLAETTRALASLARDEFGKKVRFEDMRVFDLSISLGLGEDEFARFMAAAHAPEFLANLEPVDGAQISLEAWSAAGAKISLITGRPPETLAATRDWLESRAIPHDRLEFIDKYGRYPGRSTTSLGDLRRRKYQLAIEDSSEMAEYLVGQCGWHVLLFDRPWNQSKPGHDSAERAEHPTGSPSLEALGEPGTKVQRVRDWREIRLRAEQLVGELGPAASPRAIS